MNVTSKSVRAWNLKLCKGWYINNITIVQGSSGGGWCGVGGWGVGKSIF